MSSPKIVFSLVIVVLAASGVYLWNEWRTQSLNSGFARGNGRLEATEIDVASKLSGRLDAVLVAEGDYVTRDQVLARMQPDSLNAQHDEAQARQQQAQQAVEAARAQVMLQQSNLHAAEAMVAQQLAQLYAAERRLQRTQQLAKKGIKTAQELDDDQATVSSMQAALAAARAQVGAVQAGVNAAQMQVGSAEANVVAVHATITRIDVELADSLLKAPRDGRVQYLIAQPGEVIGVGGKVLSMIDLTDVYMTFFLPAAAAGQIALGSEARIVLDAAPDTPIPATISFVASQAQFTPKTVETASEREKLMFRVRARIAPELLLKYIDQVKSGLTGVAWVKLDAAAVWPDELASAELSSVVNKAIEKNVGAPELDATPQ